MHLLGPDPALDERSQQTRGGWGRGRPGPALPGSVRTFDVSNHFMEVMEVWRCGGDPRKSAALTHSQILFGQMANRIILLFLVLQRASRGYQGLMGRIKVPLFFLSSLLPFLPSHQPD